MAIELSYDGALALLQRAVSERGEDYVYVPRDHADSNEESVTTCRYFKADGTPSCGVGLALSYMDLTKAELDEHDINVGIGVTGLTRAELVEGENRAISLLAYFQQMQDEGKPWGKALEFAITSVQEDDRSRAEHATA